MQKRRATRYSLVLTLALLAIYLLENLVFGPRMGGLMGNYIFPALTWGGLLAVNLMLPGARPAGKLRWARLLRWMALMCVFIGMLGMLLEGMMGGFGNSPYDHSLTGLLVNIISLAVMLTAVEMSRSWLLHRYFKRRPLPGAGVIVLGFTLLALPLNQVFNLHDKLTAVKFLGATFLPSLADNILATYFAFLGGPLPAIIYRGGIMLAEHLSPYLPASSWVAQTLLGTAAPLLGVILVHMIYNEEAGRAKASQGEQSSLSWFASGVACILVLWFALGVFSYAPRVILSGSMVPVLNVGDVVIIKDIEGSEAQLGDIIFFPQGEIKVTHRVVAIQESDGKRKFITKGDANPDADHDLVPEGNVMGRVVLVVPKAGWLTLALRGAL